MAEEEVSRDQVTVEESSSWLQRVGQSFAGVLFGIVLVVGGALAYGATRWARACKAAARPALAT